MSLFFDGSSARRRGKAYREGVPPSSTDQSRLRKSASLDRDQARHRTRRAAAPGYPADPASNACADFSKVSHGVVAKHPVGRLMGIRRSRNRRSPISSSVTSLRSSIISTMPRARRSLKTFASLAAVPSAPIAGSFDPARIAVEIERRPGRRLAALTYLPQTPLNLALQIIAQRSCDYHLYHVDVGTSFGTYYQLAIDSLIAGLL